MTQSAVHSLIAVLFLAGVHSISGRSFVKKAGSRIISFCGGIALAYLFLHLLPALAELQYELLQDELANRSNSWFREHLYVLALIGLLIFYLVDGYGKLVKGKARKTAFLVETLFFALYSGIVAYTLAESAELNRPLLLMTVALAAHFFGVDLDLAENYNDLFRKWGLPLLAALTIAGWTLGMIVRFERFALAGGFSFLSGGILINTLRTELHAPQQENMAYLIAGTALYAILILLIFYVVR